MARPVSPFGVVYGTITVGALLAAESAQRETYAETVGAVLIALLLFWLAHSYAQLASRRFEESEPLALERLLRIMVHEFSIMVGAAIPLGTLLLFWVAGARLTSAVTAAIWTSAAVILLLELVIGIRARLSGREMLAQTAMGAVLGVLVIALKIVLH
jgi:L-asparaginase II